MLPASARVAISSCAPIFIAVDAFHGDNRVKDRWAHYAIISFVSPTTRCHHILGSSFERAILDRHSLGLDVQCYLYSMSSLVRFEETYDNTHG